MAFGVALSLAAQPAPDELDTLVQWMSGSFTSAEQARADSSFFDIRLQMVPVWSQRDDGSWLYVEQAAASTLDRPYRQRMYRVTRASESEFRREVYTIPEPLRFAGAWADPERLDTISPDSLRIRQGCAVFLRRVSADEFRGATRGRERRSSLRGATYATSQVAITADGIESWDRGFDEADEQVWGAVDGPHEFRKVTGD